MKGLGIFVLRKEGELRTVEREHLMVLDVKSSGSTMHSKGVLESWCLAMRCTAAVRDSYFADVSTLPRLPHSLATEKGPVLQRYQRSAGWNIPKSHRPSTVVSVCG